MRAIEIDEEVYRALEARVEGFGDTPNVVLRRLLGIGAPAKAVVPAPWGERRSARKNGRSKARKANLGDLVRVGSLAEGQTLYMHNYQGRKVNGVQAIVRGNELEYEGRRGSMSALAKELMKDQGYGSDSYRGPQFWYTAEGKSVKDLWDEYLKALER